MAGEFDELVVGLAEEAAEELIRRASSAFDVSMMLDVVVSEDNALLFLAWEGEGVLKPWSIPGVATTRL